MRNKDILLDLFEDIKILQQYFYLSEDNKIIVTNEVCDLEIYMREDFTFLCKSLKFPDLDYLNYTSSMTISAYDAIISQLKQQPSTKHGGVFKNKWEEIKEETLTNTALNMFTRK